MKLRTLSLSNFCSYKTLEFDLSVPGLSLVYGHTGSGKSTLFDAAAWAAYGVTARGCAVDEVRSWSAQGEPTQVTLVVETPQGPVGITRVRGTQKENDLYWQELSHIESEDKIRGKDLTDTQKLLEERLGVTSDLYLTGAYFHEFSATGTFFTAKAKERRALFENIAPIGLSIRLAEAASNHRKQQKVQATQYQQQVAKITGALDSLISSIDGTEKHLKKWGLKQADQIEHMRELSATFDERKKHAVANLEEEVQLCERNLPPLAGIESTISAIKARLKELSSVICPQCGSPKSARDEIDLRKTLADYSSKLIEARRQRERLAHIQAELDEARLMENSYAQTAEAYISEINPFQQQLLEQRAALSSSQLALIDAKARRDKAEHQVSLLDKLYDVSFQLRGELLKKSVKEIETATNGYLERHFESEISVKFELESSDSLSVDIQKSGHDCTYKQLSKGQRSLLKLCFSVSVMLAAANNAGVHFENLAFDEALDGLDNDLKIKAFGLFEELEKSHNIIVIDHYPELQQLFHRRYKVTLVGDNSQIEMENE